MEFPLSVRWRGGRLAFAHAHDDVLRVAAPSRFRDRPDVDWSPEELLAASAASCYALTLAAVAERREVPLLDATLSAVCHVDRFEDGRVVFRLIEIEATLETLPGSESAARSVAETAEARCAVTEALAVPVRITVAVTTASRRPTG